jgi:hypothetical protein
MHFEVIRKFDASEKSILYNYNYFSMQSKGIY